MGHFIDYQKIPSTVSEDEILKDLNEFAFDPLESNSYHGNLTFHKDIVCKNIKEAEKRINDLDNGWYDDHAVLFYEDGEKYWLVKYEYHC